MYIILLTFGLGLSKAVLAYMGQSVAPTTIEFVLAVVVTIGYCLLNRACLSPIWLTTPFQDVLYRTIWRSSTQKVRIFSSWTSHLALCCRRSNILLHMSVIGVHPPFHTQTLPPSCSIRLLLCQSCTGTFKSMRHGNPHTIGLPSRQHSYFIHLYLPLEIDYRTTSKTLGHIYMVGFLSSEYLAVLEVWRKFHIWVMQRSRIRDIPIRLWDYCLSHYINLCPSQQSLLLYIIPHLFQTRCLEPEWPWFNFSYIVF